jgi:hypothetical protein
MNIRPRPGETGCDSHSLPQFRPVSQALFLAVRMFVPAPDVARPWHSQGTPEPCHVRAVEKPSSLPSRRITEPIPQPPCPALPPGCWRSCSLTRMSVASASKCWRPRGLAKPCPACCALWSRPASCRGRRKWAPRPWLAYRHDPGLGRVRRGPTFQCTGRAREAAMTWDQAVTLLILPGIVALVLGLGGIWLARRIP